MKDFKKLIKESHLGNPLNEVDDSKTVSTKHLDAIIYEDGGVKLRINSSNKSPYGYTKRDLIKSPFGVPDGKFTFDYIKKEINEVYTKFPDEEIKELLDKVDQYKNSLNEEDRATRVDKMLSGEYEDEDYKDSKRYDDVRAELDEEISDEIKAKYDDAAMDEYGKPFAELDIAQKQELMRAIIKYTGKGFETDFTRRRKGDYSDDRDDGMTDYQRRRMDEEFKKGDKVTYLGNPAEITFVGKDLMDRTYYSVSYDKGRGKTKASNLYNKDGEIKAVKEDMNDPVLMKTRAAQMKRDAMDKKDLENKSKRISADEAIDLRYELSILNKEREDILMRIEDLGVEMEQTSEPEGGPIADKLGERLMAADKELRAVNNKIIDIKDDLGVFDMNESVNEEKDYSKMHNVELNATYKKKFGVKDTKGLTRDELIKKLNDADLSEGNGGAKQDDEINLNVSNANDIADEEEAHSGVLELRNKLKENLTNRLK
jgi:hypothetical protein